MSARSFRSVFMVASCAGAALGCYLVSLRVASERAALEDVETKIVLAQRDIRLLQTEIGTRGRLAQLERWNVKVIALSAPTADQFLKGGFELARLTAPEREASIDAPVILAAAPAVQAPTATRDNAAEAAPSQRPAAMLHHAGLKTTPPRKAEVALEPRGTASPVAALKAAAGVPKPVTVEKSKAAAAPSKVSASDAGSKVRDARTRTASAKALPVKAATPATAKKTSPRDPLAPLPEVRTKVAAAKVRTTKEPARKQ